MGTKLVKTETTYHLVVNDKIIGSLGDSDGKLQKLSKENCDEIFGVVDINKWANEKVDNRFNETDGYHKFVYVDGIVDGFNKAIDLNKDKLFTVEDMVGYFDWHKKQGYVSHKPDDIHEYIQSLQQPTEIEIEIVMESTRPIHAMTDKGIKSFTQKEKLDENGCIVLRKK